MAMLRVQRTNFKVGDFLSWQRSGSLRLSPAFQRRPVWPTAAKSLLIDTVVKGIPMPIIFLRERTTLATREAQREVVDGQQRLRTLFSFIEPSALRDFREERDAFTVDPIHNKEIAGKSFDSLPSKMQSDIIDYEFSVQVLASDTGDQEVLQIFARLNSTGYKLNPQELRNAEWFGAFKTMAYELALEQLGRRRHWKIFSEQDIARMDEVEETSDLMITIVAGLHGKNQNIIGRYYRQFDQKFAKASEVRRRFQEVMDLLGDTLGEEIKATQFRRKPLFNSLFTFYYDLAYGLGTELTKTKARQLPRKVPEAVRKASQDIARGNLPEALIKLLRGGTNHLPSRQARLGFLQ